MTTKLNLNQSLLAGLYEGAVSAIVNTILFLTFHGMGVIVDTIFVSQNKPLTVAPVILSSIIPLIVGSIIFFLIEKYTRNGSRIFSIIAIVFALLSCLGPFTAIPGITTGFALVLCSMHITPATSLLVFINKETKNNK